ncbi:MAG: AsmA family protein [Victivallaceae bacterium]|nr:AsmA family protein [Victivallaceae bacterium]
MIAKGKKKFFKILTVTLVSLLLVLAVLFFIVTSSGFITGVVLPAVSSSIDMRIQAEKVDLSLFSSHLSAGNIRIGSGKKALAEAEKLDLYFSLGSLLSGNIVFRDVLLDKAVITIARDTNGKWTYESPETKSGGNAKPAPGEKKSSSTEMEKIPVDLKNVQITNSSFILATGNAGQTASVMEFRDLNINLPQFRNNETAVLNFKSRVSVKSDSGITVERGEWNFTLTAAFDEYLLPYKLTLASNLDKLDGTINGVKINNSNLALDIEAQGDKKSITIEKFCLRQKEKEFIKTNLELNSRIDFRPFKIKGKFKVAPLSAEISSIICQFIRQVNPGRVGVSWISDFEYSENGFAGAGKLRLSRKDAALINGKKYEFPDLLLSSEYDFAFDDSQKALQVKNFNTELSADDKKVLSLKVDKAFTYSFEKQTFIKERKPNLSLAIRQLDLSLIKLLQSPDSGFIIHGGRLDGDIACVLDYSRKMSFGANLRAGDLDIQAGSARFKNIGFQQKLSGFLNKNLLLSVPKFRFDLNSGENMVASFGGFVNADFRKNTAEFALNLNNLSSHKFSLLPLPGKIVDGITGITGKLEPFTLNVLSGGSVRMDSGEINLNPVKINFFQDNKKVISISAEPYAGKINNFADKLKLVLVFNDLPVRQFRKLLQDDTVTAGGLNGKIIADAENGFKTIRSNSALSIDDMQLKITDKIFKNLRLNLATSGSMTDFDKIRIKDFVLGIRQNSNVITGVSGYGNLNTAGGNGELNLTLDYLNYNLLNILTGAQLRSGIIKGAFKLAFRDNFRSTDIKSDLSIDRLNGGSAVEAVDGLGTFEAELKPDLFHCRKFVFTVKSREGEVVNLNGSTILPAEKSKAVVIKLNSKIIDIEKIQRIFDIQEEKTTVEEVTYSISDTPDFIKNAKDNEPAPLSFDLGTKKYLLLVDLQGIKYNSVLTAHVKSEIECSRKQINVKNLQINSNKDIFTMQGDFLSTVHGIKYNIETRSDKFNLSPIFHTFLEDQYKTTQLTIKNFHTKVSGTGLLPLGLWDNMTGFAKTEVENIKIPNALSDTLLGKIILLPFQILVDIQKMIPSKALKAMGKAAQFVSDFQHKLKILGFTDGKIDLESQGGRIYIRNFYLRGKIVRSLIFYGDYGLGSDQALKLRSHLDVEGIILPVDMRGTVKKPKINYSRTVIDFMGANTFNILDTTGEIIEKSGDGVKRILDSILDR